MKHRLCVMMSICGLAFSAIAQDSPPTNDVATPVPDLVAPAQSTAQPVARSGVPWLVERLSALQPSDPRAYFELGEEVAYELPYIEGQALARTLFVLAFEMDRAAGGRTGLARSACLALADLSTRNAERRWLLAMASMEPGEARSVAPPDAGEASGIDDAPFEMAVAIGWYRAEEFRRAREVIADAEAPLVLRRVGIDKDKAEQFVGQIRERVTRGVACDRCRNERVIRRAGEGGRPTLELCPLCRGNPGPRLTEEEFLESLRVEGILLGCRPTSWAAGMLLSGGLPLRDAEPDELAAWFGVNAQATQWRPGTTDPVNPDRAWMTGSWQAPQAEAPADPVSSS